METLCDPIAISVSCYSAGTELWDLAQRDTQSRAAAHLQPGAGPRGGVPTVLASGQSTSLWGTGSDAAGN